MWTWVPRIPSVTRFLYLYAEEPMLWSLSLSFLCLKERGYLLRTVQTGSLSLVSTKSPLFQAWPCLGTDYKPWLWSQVWVWILALLCGIWQVNLTSLSLFPICKRRITMLLSIGLCWLPGAIGSLYLHRLLKAVMRRCALVAGLHSYLTEHYSPFK